MSPASAAQALAGHLRAMPVESPLRRAVERALEVLLESGVVGARALTDPRRPSAAEEAALRRGVAFAAAYAAYPGGPADVLAPPAGAGGLAVDRGPAETLPLGGGWRLVEDVDRGRDALGRRRFVMRDEVNAFCGDFPEETARGLAAAVREGFADAPAEPAVAAPAPAAEAAERPPRFYTLDSELLPLDAACRIVDLLNRVPEGHAVVKVTGISDAYPEGLNGPATPFDQRRYGFRAFIDRRPPLGRAP